jgi:hypothetical protein
MFYFSSPKETQNILVLQGGQIGGQHSYTSTLHVALANINQIVTES